MTYQKTKDQLIEILSDSEVKVVSLAGKWGTGKTFLIDEIRASLPLAKDAVYASLFGLSTVDELKSKLMEAAVPMAESHGALIDGAKELIRVGLKAASEHYKALASVSTAQFLLMSPVILGKKLIIIDDIERRHAKLGVDEVLGFIDEFSKRHESRFVLVLNDDRLQDEHKISWQTLFEKVIDEGVKLSTSAAEAFAIAIYGHASPCRPQLEKAIFTCDLTNIRIIKKIIKVATRVLGNQGLTPSIEARVIPSIVLFSAIHYRGLQDGPDMHFALNIGNRYNRHARERKMAGTATEEDKREERWTQLINELGIRSCDDFEIQLVNFLESGLVEAGLIDKIVEDYKNENDRMEARASVDLFFFDVIWNHPISESELLKRAGKFPAIAKHLDPYVASELASSVRTLDGGSEIAQLIIAQWVAAFRKRQDSYEVSGENPFDRPLDPAIQAEIESHNKAVYDTSTITDAVLKIQSGGWNTLEEFVLRKASVSDFDLLIRTMDPNKLRGFMRRMLELYTNKTNYEKFFGNAAHNFMEACKGIIADSTSPRLSKLISNVTAAARGTTSAVVEHGNLDENHFPNS